MHYTEKEAKSMSAMLICRYYEYIHGTVNFHQLGFRIMKVPNQLTEYDDMLKYFTYSKLRVEAKE